MAKSKRKKRRTKSRRESYSLLISLLISAFIVALWSYIQLPRMYASYVYSPLDHPVVAVAMQGIHDGVYPWSFIDIEGDKNISDIVSDPATAVRTEPDVFEEASETDVTEAVPEPETIVEEPEPEAIVKESEPEVTEAAPGPQEIEEEPVPEGTEDGFTSESAEPEDTEPVPKEFITVDDDYFKDALFIGDSRMVGLSQYCEPLDTRADFYVKKALTIYNILDGKPIRSFDGTSKSLWEVLEEKQYAKIYIMVGINEIGVGNSEYFKDAYSQVVDRIREAEPHALVYINSIMHVSKSKSDNDGLYNNSNINARNDAIASLADDINIFYLNINEAVDDENGALRADLTFDDIHLRGSSYEPWHEYLLTHAIEAKPLPEVHHVLEGHPVE